MATEEVILDVEPIDLSDILPPISPGYDWKWSFYVLDDNEDPIDVTGWACEIKLKDRPNGETKASLSTSGGQIALTPASGLFSITLAAASSATIDCRQVVFDVKLTDDAAGITRPFMGTVKVLEVVS